MFLQVFFYPHNEEDIKISSLNSEEKQLLLRIRQEIAEVNPFIRTLTDIIDVTGALTDRATIPNFRIILSDLHKKHIVDDIIDQLAQK
jgi:hypothetical protein